MTKQNPHKTSNSSPGRHAPRRRGRSLAGGKFGGLMIVPDAALASVIGGQPVSPSAMTKKLWTYIKKHGLTRKQG